mgnify:CR=1 FL=1
MSRVPALETAPGAHRGHPAPRRRVPAPEAAPALPLIDPLPPRRAGALDVARTELTAWRRTRPAVPIAGGWACAAVLAAIVLAGPYPIGALIWWSLYESVDASGHTVTAVEAGARLAFDVVTVMVAWAAVGCGSWIGAESRRAGMVGAARAAGPGTADVAPTAPGTAAGTIDVAPGTAANTAADPDATATAPGARALGALLAAWARCLAVWSPGAVVLVIATPLGGAPWPTLILLLAYLIILSGAACGLGAGARAVLPHRDEAAQWLALLLAAALTVAGPILWATVRLAPEHRPAAWGLAVTSPHTGVSDIMSRTAQTRVLGAAASLIDADRGPTGTGGARRPPAHSPVWPKSLAVAVALGGAGAAARAAGLRLADRGRTRRTLPAGGPDVGGELDAGGGPGANRCGPPRVVRPRRFPADRTVRSMRP